MEPSQITGVDQSDSAQQSLAVSELIHTCLRRRIPEDQFVQLLRELISKSQYENPLVYHDLISSPVTVTPDPLHIHYIVRTMSSNPPILSLSRLLDSLQTTPLGLRIDIMQALTPVVAKIWTASSADAVAELIVGLVQYLDEITSSSANLFLDADELSASANEIFRDVAAELVISVTENPTIDKMFRFIAPEQRQRFERSLTLFTEQLMLANKSLGETLSLSTQKFISDPRPPLVLEPKPESHKPQSLKLTWMESMLLRRPKFGSHEFSEKIEDLFKSQSADAAISNLVSAAFDCLVKCATAQDQARVSLWKTFIIKRQYLAGVPSSTLEYSLRRPLLSINDDALSVINAQPANDIDLMFAAPAPPYDVRHEFLTSMVQLRLLDLASVERILGGSVADMTDISDAAAVNVTNIVTSLTETFDVESVLKQFVEEIESLGCLGQSAAVDVIMVLVQIWPSQRETYRLRVLAQEIALSTEVMNIILVYKDPYELLLPLIDCLDSWSYEDESNFQDNYTDFGMILLLICSFFYHFELDLAEFSKMIENSFCLKYLTSSGAAHPIESLGQESMDILGGWIISLFDTNGISDDMMRSCSPMNYALLVPTILQQSVAACNRNLMDIETLKGGIEYFLHPFLLFSVVGALHWLAHDLWTVRDYEITLQILQAIVTPQFLSDDAQAMHKVVLRVSGLPVYNMIQMILQKVVQVPDTVNLNEIMDTLAPHLQFRRGL